MASEAPTQPSLHGNWDDSTKGSLADQARRHKGHEGSLSKRKQRIFTLFGIMFVATALLAGALVLTTTVLSDDDAQASSASALSCSLPVNVAAVVRVHADNSLRFTHTEELDGAKVVLTREHNTSDFDDVDSAKWELPFEYEFNLTTSTQLRFEVINLGGPGAFLAEIIVDGRVIITSDKTSTTPVPFAFYLAANESAVAGLEDAVLESFPVGFSIWSSFIRPDTFNGDAHLVWIDPEVNGINPQVNDTSSFESVTFAWDSSANGVELCALPEPQECTLCDTASVLFFCSSRYLYRRFEGSEDNEVVADSVEGDGFFNTTVVNVTPDTHFKFECLDSTENSVLGEVHACGRHFATGVSTLAASLAAAGTNEFYVGTSTLEATTVKALGVSALSAQSDDLTPPFTHLTKVLENELFRFGVGFKFGCEEFAVEPLCPMPSTTSIRATCTNDLKITAFGLDEDGKYDVIASVDKSDGLGAAAALASPAISLVGAADRFVHIEVECVDDGLASTKGMALCARSPSISHVTNSSTGLTTEATNSWFVDVAGADPAPSLVFVNTTAGDPAGNCANLFSDGRFVWSAERGNTLKFSFNVGCHSLEDFRITDL